MEIASTCTGGPGARYDMLEKEPRGHLQSDAGIQVCLLCGFISVVKLGIKD